MILLLFGLYAVITGKFMITSRLGLKDGARLAGVACILLGAGVFADLFARPATALGASLGLGEAGPMVVSVILQLVALAAILAILIRIYGNNHSAAEAHLEKMADALAKPRPPMRAPKFRIKGNKLADGAPFEYLSRADTLELAQKSAASMGLDPATIAIEPLDQTAGAALPGSVDAHP